jgi:hypothetical protein
MPKQRGYPDRRGMGAQSDFIAEQFVPDESYKSHQRAMIDALRATGVDSEALAKMFHIPAELLTDKERNKQ